MSSSAATFDLDGLLRSKNIDPNQFHQLPTHEQNLAFEELIPGYKTLPPPEKVKALTELQFGPQAPEESTGRKVARSGALGFASGISGLPETTENPAAAAAKGLGQAPSLLERLDPTSGGLTGAIGIGRNLYRAGKEIVAGRDPEEIAHGVGSLAGQGAQFAIGARAGPKALEGRVAESEVLHPTTAFAGGLEKAGTEDVFRASVPGAGAKDFNLRANVEVAKPDLAQIQRETPLEGAGGFKRPDLRLRNFADNVKDYKQKLWKEQVERQINRWGDAQVDLRPIKKAMRDTITQTDIESNPSGVKQIEKWIERMPDTDTMRGMAERRKTINAYLRSFEEKTGSEQAAAMKTKPLVEALKAQDKGIQSQMFQELKRRGEPGIDAIERRYVALSDLEDAARSQLNAAEAFRFWDRMRFYINPRNLLSANERLTATPTAGKMMQRGMRRLGATELQPAPAPRVGPRPTPPPSRMLPAPGGTSTTEVNPALGQQAPGGPRTTLRGREMPESGGEPARGPFGASPSDVGAGGPPARIPERPPNLRAGNQVIPAGTATPKPRILSTEEASSLPGIERQASLRSKLQAIIDDPAATAGEKSVAREKMRKLGGGSRVRPRSKLPPPPSGDSDE